MSWVIQHNYNYGETYEECYETAEEVVRYLDSCSREEREDMVIFPEPSYRYEPFEFIQAWRDRKVF